MAENIVNEELKFRGAGGTPGVFGEFFIGLIMAVAGAYILINRVTVTRNYSVIYV